MNRSNNKLGSEQKQYKYYFVPSNVAFGVPIPLFDIKFSPIYTPHPPTNVPLPTEAVGIAVEYFETPTSYKARKSERNGISQRPPPPPLQEQGIGLERAQPSETLLTASTHRSTDSFGLGKPLRTGCCGSRTEYHIFWRRDGVLVRAWHPVGSG